MAHYLLSPYNFPWLLLPRQPDPGHRGDELRRAAEEGRGGGGGCLARGGGAEGEFPPRLLQPLLGGLNVLRPELCTSGPPYLCFDPVCDVSTVFPAQPFICSFNSSSDKTNYV